MSEQNWFRGDADMLAYSDEWLAKHAPPPVQSNPQPEPKPQSATTNNRRSSDSDSGIWFPLAIGMMGLLNL